MFAQRQSVLPYSVPFATIIAPAADAGGRTGKWLSLKNAVKAWVVAEINQGNAATVLLSVLQAKDSSGTSSKAISNAAPIWLVNDTSTSDAFVAQTAGTTFTTDATTKDKIVCFELTPDLVLDVAGGFCFVTMSTGASNAANITSARLYVGTAYPGASPPSLYS